MQPRGRAAHLPEDPVSKKAGKDVRLALEVCLISGQPQEVLLLSGLWTASDGSCFRWLGFLHLGALK